MKAKKSIIPVFILLIAAILLGMRMGSHPAPIHPFFDNFEHNPIVLAHQGGDEVWPGDTLFAFEQAAALGVDILEMDAHITKDNILVIIHDESIDRTTNGHGLVEELTLDEIKQFDAAYWGTQGDGAS